MTAPAPLAKDKILFLATGLAGSLLVGISAQFASANIADIQGGLHGSADETSWVLTAYTMSSFAGIVTSGPLFKAFGIGRYLIGISVVFAAMALACAMTDDLATAIVLRAIQGFAAGGFNPAAFVAVFMVMGGPRLAGGATLLAFVLLFPSTLGPVVSGLIEDSLGWRSLFLVQATIGVAVAVAAYAFAPRQRPDLTALKTDWTAIVLLSTALAALILVLNEGTRRFWFESDIIVRAAAASAGALAGFAFVTRFSPIKIMAPQLLLTRSFGLPIWLNLVFRIGLVVISYLVPQFLARVHGYRPLEISELMLWAAIPQLATLPVVWWLMQVFERRLVMALGLLLCAFGTALLVDGTGYSAAEEFRLTLVIFAVGQLLFLAPLLVASTSTLKPADLPTASLAFNISTVGGTTLGAGLISNLVTEREKFHSNVITEAVSLYNALDADRVANVAAVFANRIADDAAAAAKAVAVLASAASRQAWVLSFNDAFLVIAVVLAVSALGVVALDKSAPLRRQQNIG
jgi:MFS transporter, DHA2 family, multidrug resistance protein